MNPGFIFFHDIGYKTYAPGIGIVQDGNSILLVKIE